MHSMTKQALRKQYIALRNNQPAEKLADWSSRIASYVLQLIEDKNLTVIMLYAAFRNEPETRDLIWRLLNLGKTVALPKCEKGGVMTAYQVETLEQLRPGTYGILEPEETKPVLPERFDLVLVPGCAFGRDMTRLGYGGGYYDRYLPKCQSAIKIGLCYEICLTDSLPMENFDIQMDYLITENGVVNNL